MNRRTFDVAVVGLGGIGSATVAQLARRGVSVAGFEQFALGHDRGASHDTSRILRHSYHTPGYVALTHEAYQDWADLEAVSGESLVTITGGVDLFPQDGAIPIIDYTTSMDAHGIDYEMLDVAAVAERFPQFRLPEGTVALHQARTGIVHAARTVGATQAVARAAGATLIDNTPVLSLRPVGNTVELDVADGTTYSCGAVVVSADAWTEALLAPLGVSLPLTVTEEQVTYFDPLSPSEFTPDRFPVWIWMDEPSFYGFPSYGEPTMKAAQDCGGPVVTGDHRSGEADLDMVKRLAAFMSLTVPRSGRPGRSKRCLYTLTPDRDFVLDRVSGAERIVVGLGAAHGFKFVPTFGRRLADLALGAPMDPELAAFSLDRPALTDPDFVANWMV
jgi:monomeric sarcosine oxidase